MKPVPNYENYLVYPCGCCWNIKTNKPKRAYKQGNGRLAFAFTKPGHPKPKFWQVHRLVAHLYLGPSDLDINHIDFNPLNNHVSNLEYVTRKQNYWHSRRAGRMQVGLPGYNRGEASARSKLTDADVRVIKERLASGSGPTAIAKDYGVHPNTIQEIKNGNNWKHID